MKLSMFGYTCLFGALLVGWLDVVVDCKPVSNPAPLVEAGEGIVDNTCTLLTGLTQNQTVISICATVEEVATIAAYVGSFLRHGDFVDAGACTPLAHTGVCATRSELGQAIQLVTAKRRARYLIDASAP